MIASVLTITQTMEPLPDGCELSMKLEFNEEVPDNFEQQHFRAVDSLGINFYSNPSSFKLGNIESRFTSLALSTKTVFLSKDDDDNDVNQSEPIDFNEDDEVEPSQSEVLLRSFTSPTNEVQEVHGITNAEQDVATTGTSLSALPLKEKEVNCICECTDHCKDDLICNSCSMFQHRACYKVLETEEAGNHICVNCHDPSNPDTTCSESDLLNNIKIKEEALYRRALVLCLSNVRVSVTTFVNQMGVPRQTALQIFNRLDKDDFLCPAAGKGNVRIVKTSHVKNMVLNRKFNLLSVDVETNDMETDENNMGQLSMQKRKRTNNSENKENRLCGRNSLDQPKRTKYVESSFNERILR